MSLRTPLGRARGLGSAKEGASHWWAQRVTALAQIPLVLWFAYFFAGSVHADYATASARVAEPVNALLLVLLLASIFYHAQLGLQVVIEDYVHAEAVKLTTLLLMKFVMIVLAASAIFAVLRVALGA